MALQSHLFTANASKTQTIPVLTTKAGTLLSVCASIAGCFTTQNLTWAQVTTPSADGDSTSYRLFFNAGFQILPPIPIGKNSQLYLVFSGSGSITIFFDEQELVS